MGIRYVLSALFPRSLLTTTTAKSAPVTAAVAIRERLLLMQFSKTSLDDLYVIELSPFVDERGSFARVFCSKEFSNAGISYNIVQSNLSLNTQRGTLRGLHFQLPPYEEGKLIRCIRGEIFDVVVDLRRQSSTFRHSFCVELSESNGKALFVPPGFAHGFQTLTDDTQVLYMMTQFYSPDHVGGYRWNDAAFNIAWPIVSPILSDKDLSFPDFLAEDSPF